MYHIMKEAWDNGLEIAELPSKVDFPLPTVGDPKEIGYDIYRKQFSAFKKIQQKNYDLHSLRCDLNLKFAVAEKFKGEKFAKFSFVILLILLGNRLHIFFPAQR